MEEGFIWPQHGASNAHDAVIVGDLGGLYIHIRWTVLASAPEDRLVCTSARKFLPHPRRCHSHTNSFLILFSEIQSCDHN